jgi:transcriptional regulator with XRE-family HTH domain
MRGMAATDLGTRIRRARERRRWTQQQLADAVGWSLRAVSNWENGHRHPRGAIGKLEEVLGVDLSKESQDPKELELRESLSWMDEDEIEQVVYAYRQRRASGRLRQVS